MAYLPTCDEPHAGPTGGILRGPKLEHPIIGGVLEGSSHEWQTIVTMVGITHLSKIGAIVTIGSP